MVAEWHLGDESKLGLVANLSNDSAATPIGLRAGHSVWNGELPKRLPPWFVHWSIGAH
jgi:hypothetical protein